MGSAPKTAFRKISMFNELIGNAHGGGALRQQFKIIEEEFLELAKALDEYEILIGIAEKNFTPETIHAAQIAFGEVRDGTADLLVTTYGLGHRAGIDCDADLDAVFKSNMTKFVKGTEDDAKTAGTEIGQRLALDVEVNETAPGIWAVTSERDQWGIDGKEYPQGKLLKPSTYESPVFEQEQFAPEGLKESDLLKALEALAPVQGTALGADATEAQAKPLNPGLDQSHHGDLPGLSTK